MNHITCNKKNDTCYTVHATRARGFTLIEMIAYVVILSLTLIAVITAIVGVMRSYASTQAKQNLARSASTVLERISREVRLAETADTLESSFGTHPGILQMTALNDTKTTKFYVENGTLKLDVDGSYVGNLTADDVLVNSFIVKHIQTGASEAIRTELILETLSRGATTTESYYSTAVMRGSYTQ